MSDILNRSEAREPTRGGGGVFADLEQDVGKASDSIHELDRPLLMPQDIPLRQPHATIEVIERAPPLAVLLMTCPFASMSEE